MTPHRANIIFILNLIATPADQLEYQRRIPLVNVANELVNHWFDDFYHPGDRQFDSEFSTGELASLSDFNRQFDKRVDKLPDTVEEMLRSRVWTEIIDLAGQVLDAHGWRGVDPSYDTPDEAQPSTAQQLPPC